MLSPGQWRGLRDALAKHCGDIAAGLRERGRLVASDSSSFLRMLRTTLANAPYEVLAASIVINLLGLSLPLAMLQVYDRIVPQSATLTLACLIVGVCGALVFQTILTIARARVVAWAAMQRAWRTNVDAAARVALAPANLVDAQPAARWMQRLQAVATISEFESGPTPLVLIDLVFVLILLALLVATSGWLAAVPVVIFLLGAVAVIKRGPQLRAAATERLVAETKIHDFLVQALNGIVTVKTLGTEEQILRRFERLSEQAARGTQDAVRLADYAQGSGALISILTQIATSTIGAILAIEGRISIGVVVCSTVLAGRVVQPLLRLVMAWNEIQSVMVAEEAVGPIFDLPQSAPLRPASVDQELPARLVFEGVTFARSEREIVVLDEASLDVEPGELVAITGKDNIGKSTVAQLAAGQLVANSGLVLVDGLPTTTTAAQRHGHIVMVDHRNAAMRGTVLNNLTLFQDAERLEAARAAARLLGLESEVNRLPRGYYTRIGDAATEALPPALLQRIAIARAIAGKPRLLILDEATNSFDYASREALSQGLVSLRGKMTVLLITSRSSFASIADRVFTLIDGKFVRLDRTDAPGPTKTRTVRRAA